MPSKDKYLFVDTRRLIDAARDGKIRVPTYLLEAKPCDTLHMYGGIFSDNPAHHGFATSNHFKMRMTVKVEKTEYHSSSAKTTITFTELFSVGVHHAETDPN